MLLGEGIIRRSVALLRNLYDHQYNRAHPVSALYRLARWQVHKRLSPKPRVYPFWGTRQILCWPDSAASMWLVYNQVPDWNEFEFIRLYVKRGDVAFDVGANIGIYSLWLSQFTENVTAFEPDPENHLRCARNIVLNNVPVKLERLALSDRAGWIAFSSGRDMENRIVPGGDGDNGKLVEATTLDAYCAARGIETVDYLKIDIEGAEFSLLTGAERMLRKRAIRVIQLELVERSLRNFGVGCADVEKLLASHGYALYGFHFGKLHPKDSDKEQNVFAIADIRAVTEKLSAVCGKPAA